MNRYTNNRYILFHIEMATCTIKQINSPAAKRPLLGKYIIFLCLLWNKLLIIKITADGRTNDMQFTEKFQFAYKRQSHCALQFAWKLLRECAGRCWPARCSDHLLRSSFEFYISSIISCK